MINIKKYIDQITRGSERTIEDFLSSDYFSQPQFIINVIQKYAPAYNTLTEKEIQSYQHMLDTVQQVQRTFDRLNQFNIFPQISLVGGAVYDTVLGLEPKDYDICVYIPANPRVLSLVENILNPAPSPYPIKDSEVARISQHLFSQNISSPHSLIKKILEEDFKIQGKLKTGISDHYIFKYILDVFKVKTALSNKNIDIILTSIDSINFLSSFDFNLCKMCIPYNGEKNVKDFLANFYIAPSALYDLENKNFTVNIDKFSDEEIKYFLGKHYLRLKEKYPSYELNFKGTQELRVHKYILENIISIVPQNKEKFKL